MIERRMMAFAELGGLTHHWLWSPVNTVSVVLKILFWLRKERSTLAISDV